MQHSAKKRAQHPANPIVQDCLKAAKQCSGVKVETAIPAAGGAFKVTFIGPKGRSTTLSVSAANKGKVSHQLRAFFGS